MSIQASNNINIKDTLNNYLYIENTRFSYCEVCEKKKRMLNGLIIHYPFIDIRNILFVKSVNMIYKNINKNIKIITK